MSARQMERAGIEEGNFSQAAHTRSPTSHWPSEHLEEEIWKGDLEEPMGESERAKRRTKNYNNRNNGKLLLKKMADAEQYL